MMRKIIGLTGPSGAGKTLLAEIWRGMGAGVIRADDVYRRLLRENREMTGEIAKAFPHAAGAAGIDRRVLADIVFSDPAALECLNSVTHKYIIREIRREIELPPGSDIFIIEAIYLIESGLGKLCALTVAVTAPFPERLRRIMERDGLDAGQAERRLKSQRPDDFYARHCDMVIENTTGEDGMRSRAAQIFEEVRP